MLHFLRMCIIGLVAGAIAKLIMPGKDPGDIIVTTLLGIAGGRSNKRSRIYPKNTSASTAR